MRIATYNVEWFTHLFDDDGRLLADRGWSGRKDVRRFEQAEALGIVFTALDADGVMVIEAPDSHRGRSGKKALETFAETYGLRTRVATLGFENHTQQEIAFLYDPDRISVRHDPIGPATGEQDEGHSPRFDGVYRLDINLDATREKVIWSKPPLELAATTAGGTALRIIGVHAKSKAPHGAEGREEIMRRSIENRRKQLAQCLWLRARVEEHLAAGDSLIVLGDFNDGPGLDEYERLFGRSGVEVVMGGNGTDRLVDPHAVAALGRKSRAMPATARFWMPGQGRWMQALLDYIMISQDLTDREPRWRIWHPFEDPGCYRAPELCEALLTASDHFPVTLDIDI